jgi:hypothetical protein
LIISSLDSGFSSILVIIPGIDVGLPTALSFDLYPISNSKLLGQNSCDSSSPQVIDGGSCGFKEDVSSQGGDNKFPVDKQLVPSFGGDVVKDNVSSWDVLLSFVSSRGKECTIS